MNVVIQIAGGEFLPCHKITRKEENEKCKRQRDRKTERQEDRETRRQRDRKIDKAHTLKVKADI